MYQVKTSIVKNAVLISKKTTKTVYRVQQYVYTTKYEGEEVNGGRVIYYVDYSTIR